MADNDGRGWRMPGNLPPYARCWCLSIARPSPVAAAKHLPGL